MVILNDSNRTVIDGKVAVEAMSLNLNERGSTASLTPRDMSGLAVGKWLRDETEPGEGIVWRVRRIQMKYDTDTGTLELEHIVNTFKDYVMAGEVNPQVITGTPGATTCTALQAIQFILLHQPDWVLDQFSYGSISNGYDLSGMDLFSALERITETLEDPIWTYDTTSYPFKLSITTKSSAVTSELRAGRNIKTLSRTVDRSGMYTRIWPYGKDNMMIGTPEDDTSHYIENNVSLYGLIEHVETDTSIESKDELTAWATQKVQRHSVPQVTISVDGLELSDATGESLDKFRLGQMCHIPLAEFGQNFTERIVSLSYPDKVYQPDIVKITLSNQFTEVTKIISQIARTVSRSSRSASRSGQKVQKAALHSAVLVTNEDQSYTLHLYNLDGTESDWTKTGQITFSFAAELTRQWSSGVVTVKASRNGVDLDTLTMEIHDTDQTSDVTWSGNWASVKVQTDLDGDGLKYFTGKQLSVNATERYNAGWSAARGSVAGQTYVVDDETYNYFPTSAQSPALQYMRVAMPNNAVGGTKVTYSYFVTSDNNDAYIRYASDSGAIVAKVTHGKYDAGWLAARNSVYNKTYTVDDETYYYFPTSSPSALLGFMRTAIPNSTAGGSRVVYSYFVTSDNNDAYIRYASDSGAIVAKVTHGKYNAGWLAARNSVYNKTYTVDDETYYYFPTSSPSALLGFMRTAIPNSTAGGSRVVYSYFVTSDNNDAYIRYNSTSGAIVAQITHGKYDAGWGAARTSTYGTYTVDDETYDYFPTSAQDPPLQFMRVARPNSTVGGSKVVYSYFVTSDNNDAYIRYGNASSSAIVAKVYHGKYNAGWGAAYSKVNIPTAEVTNHNDISIQFPVSTVGSAGSRTYIMQTNGDDTVDLQTSDGQGGYITVARLNHYKYTYGWRAAYGKLVIPTAEVTNHNDITISFPAYTVGSTDSRTYIMQTNGNDVVDLQTSNGQGGYTTVARLNHGKYTAGYNAGLQDGADSIVFMTCDENANRVVNNYNAKMYDASGNLIKTLYADDPSQGSGHTSKGFFFPLSDNYPISSNGTHTPQAPYHGFRSVVVSGVKSNRIKFTRGSAVDPSGNVYNWSAQIGTNVTGSATEYYFYY